MRIPSRRHDDERVLRRRLRQPSYWWVERDGRLSEDERARFRGIYRNTGTTCSRWCCRVNRRHYGPSVQERRQVAWLEMRK